MTRISIKALSLILTLIMLITIVPLQTATAPAADLIAGDVSLDGNLNAADARLALRASAKLELLTANQIKCADIDRSRQVLANDARMILRASAQLERLSPVAPVSFENDMLSSSELAKYSTDDYEVQVMANYYTDVGDHVILDDYYDVEFNANTQFSENQKQHFVGVGFNEQNEPFFYFTDTDKLEEGIISFRVLHFSLFGVAKLSDEQLIDLWCERAAAQDVTRRISEESITPGLRDMVNDALNNAGLGENQYAGAIVRYILSHDTRGEIINAAAGGDMKTMKAKVANLAGEYIFGQVFTGQDDGILGQSMGDHADMIKDGIKEKKYSEMTVEIVKNIEKNMFAPVNYADKFAGLTVKLANIWADDAMNEEYKNFLKLGGKNISNDDWNTCVIHMRGASNWLSRNGINDRNLREMFVQRFENEAKIKREKAEMMKLVAKWKDENLISTQYWDKSNGFSRIPPLVERLNALRRIRESLKESFTDSKGKQRIGRGYMTFEDFLSDALFRWVTYGPKNRDKYYEWLRSKGIYFDDTGEIRDFAWVLSEIRVDYVDTLYFTDPGDYTYYHDATPGNHTNSIGYGSGSSAQTVTFSATCTTPPSTIRPGETVKLTMKLNNTERGKDLGLSASAGVRRDVPGIFTLSPGTGHSQFTSPANGSSKIEVRSPASANENPASSAKLEVSHKFGGPENENPKTTDDGGQQIAIYFNACGAQTVWIYEWKAVG